MFNRMAAYFISIVLMVACSSQPQQPIQQATNTPTLIPTLTPSPTSTITPTPIPTFTPTPTPLPMAGPVTENFMTRLGKGWVNDLTFSPNGKILSVATSIGVYLYQVETMQLISFLPSNGFVKDAVFIDDKTLVTGSSNGVTIVWDIDSTPKVLQTLQRTDPVVTLGVTKDKTILIIELNGSGASGTVNVINWDRVNPENVNKVSSQYVFDGEYSPANNLLALNTWMENIILVDTQKMKTTATICIKCWGYALSPNGTLLAANKYLGGQKTQMVLLDTTSQKEIMKFKEGEQILVFSPDGKLLVSSSTAGLNFWDVETFELVETIKGESGFPIAFSPDGLLLVSVSSDGNLILRETNNGNTVFTIKGFTSTGRATFQGNSIASIQGLEGMSVLDSAGGGSGFYSLDSGSIIFRDISTGEITRAVNITEENSRVKSITFSSDEKLMASVWQIDYKDKIVVIFDVTTGERLQTLKGFDPIAFSPDGSLLATGITGNQLVIWDIATGEKLPLSLGLVPVQFRDPYKKSLVFSPDGSMIAILSDKVILRDISTGKRIKSLESGLDPSLGFSGFSYRSTGALGEFSPDGTKLASTWLVATSENKLRREPKGIIILWDILSGEKIAILDGHSNPALGKYSNSITALAFSPNGTLLASGAEDNTIVIWDAKSGSQLKVLQGHSGAINSLAFSPDSTLLYSNSLDGTVIIWNIKQLLP
jgi:WD40 repeat protein